MCMKFCCFFINDQFAFECQLVKFRPDSLATFIAGIRKKEEKKKNMGGMQADIVKMIDARHVWTHQERTDDFRLDGVLAAVALKKQEDCVRTELCY